MLRVTAIKLSIFLFKNNAFSAVYESSAIASLMIFYEVGCGVFDQRSDWLKTEPLVFLLLNRFRPPQTVNRTHDF